MSDEKNERKQRSVHPKKGVVMPAMPALHQLPEEYPAFFKEIKQSITQKRLKTIHQANTDMLLLYWHIGQRIKTKQKEQNWGAKVIDRLSIDLKNAFPDIKGFSPRNLKYMVKFSIAWPDITIVQQVAAQIPWGTNMLILDKLNNDKERMWYAKYTQEHGLSRNVLAHHIEGNVYQRQGNSSNNFTRTLPPEKSDMASKIFKDPYLFDFIGTDIPHKEAELENRLLHHMEHFLIELGQGFAFVGRQVHLELGNQDFYADLLFYHLKMRCYVVVELKMGHFEPGFLSQLHIYQAVIDEQLRHETDQPTIGLLLVKDKDNLVVEYALAGNCKPIGIANWQQQLSKELPDGLKSALPSIEDIEYELTHLESEELKHDH